MTSTGEALRERAEVRSDKWWSTRSYLLPVLVVSLTVIPKLFYLNAPSLGMDEAILWVYPQEIGGGRIPNQDFFTVYGPGNYLSLLGLYKLVGHTQVVERVLAIAYQAALVAGVMRLAWRHGRTAALGAGVISALVLSGPLLIATAWSGGLALSVWSLGLLVGGDVKRTFASGFLAGLTTFWRIEMVAVAAASLPLIWKDRRALPYLAGAVAGALPALAHLALTGRALVDNVLLQRLGMSAQRDWSLLQVGTVSYLIVLSAAVLFLVVLAAKRRQRESASAAVLGVVLIPQVLQRIDYGHVQAVACVVLPLAAAALMEFVRWRSAIRLPRADLTGAFAIGALLTSMTVQSAVNAQPGAKVTHRHHTMYTTDTHARELRAVIQSLQQNVAPGAKVFIGATDMSRPAVNAIALYHLLPEYQSDFYYIEIPGGVAEKRGSPLVADIESADALVLTETPDSYFLMNPHLGEGVEDANIAVEHGFCLADDTGFARILLRAGNC